MPRAKPFPDSEEEEKTTIESQWEDEASTTVEQGDVADKIRALGVEPRRSNTNHTGTGTVDEPTVDEQHAQSAITPVRDVARLVISAGNDAGTEIEIRPGKTYTIGRAIDNDIVLTDISVSRKHFDLRFEDAAWVIVDRGSGNGTVVNGNLEDNPFMLANGDVIEIGNTQFRFDQPNAASRPQRTVDLDPDDEEMSTVAGKPMRAETQPPPPVAAIPLRTQRPKTLPPPTPMRAATQPPPVFPPGTPGPQAVAMPLPQMGARAPLPGISAAMPAPAAPTMLGDQLGAAPGPIGTTLPGQGAPRPLYAYPQATEIPPHSVHAQMLLIQTQNRRPDASTAHVSPTPFDAMPPQRYSQPQLTKRTKMILAGVGLAVLAGVLTVAIVKSGSDKPKPTAGLDKGAAKPDGKIVAKPATDDIKPEPVKAEPKASVGPTVPAPTVPAPTAPTAAKTEPKVEQKTEPKVEQKTEPKQIAKTEPVKTEPKVEQKTEPKQTAKAEPKQTAKVEPKQTTKRPAQRTEPKRETQVAVATPVKKGGDPEAARIEADRLYKAKKFNDASSYLSTQAKKFDEDDARDMRRTAELYARLGRSLAQGTAPATRATEAFEALRSAQTSDRSLGGAYEDEITTKLAQVAPKAALSYVANRKYVEARNAMIFAKQFPGAAETVNLVKQKLESAASDLYNEAVGEMGGNPAGAKDKLKQILQIVDASSPWYKKAQQKLSGG